MNKKTESAHQLLEELAFAKVEFFYENVILTNEYEFFKKISIEFDLKIFEGTIYSHVHLTNERVSILFFRGGPTSASLIMDLCSTMNITYILYFGSCIGLSSKIKIGELFIPVAASRDDFVSNHYLDRSIPAIQDPFALSQVENCLIQLELNSKKGISLSSSVNFISFPKQKIREVFQVYETECATLFSASTIYKIKIGAFLLVTQKKMEHIKEFDYRKIIEASIKIITEKNCHTYFEKEKL